MQNYSDGLPINVGVGEDISIADLAHIIAEVIGYQGAFAYDTTKPDGTPRKLLSTTRLNNLGWTAKTKLKDGIKIAHQDFLARGL
jgi:GDP-L-fucose synthase